MDDALETAELTGFERLNTTVSSCCRTDTSRDGVSHAYRQQHGLPDTKRAILDLIIHLDSRTVANTPTLPLTPPPPHTPASSSVRARPDCPARAALHGHGGAVERCVPTCRVGFHHVPPIS